MHTTLTERGQTAIPARIRKRFNLRPHQKLVWTEDGKVIFVLPVSADPIAEFRRGGRKRGLSAALLKARRQDASVA